MSVPAAEPDQHVHAHGQEALEPVGHRRRRHPQELLGDRIRQLLRGFQRDPGLSREHRAVDAEVVVVRAVERVEVHRAGPVPELRVRLDGPRVGGHRAPVVPAQHVQVRRHVVQVPGVGDQSAEPVGNHQALLRRGGHLHQVDVHVQQARVPQGRRVGQCPLQHPLGLGGAGTRCRLAGAQVPQLPWGQVHQRVGVERGHVEVVAELPVDAAHRVCVVRVPDRVSAGPSPTSCAG